MQSTETSALTRKFIEFSTVRKMMIGNNEISKSIKIQLLRTFCSWRENWEKSWKLSRSFLALIIFSLLFLFFRDFTHFTNTHSHNSLTSQSIKLTAFIERREEKISQTKFRRKLNSVEHYFGLISDKKQFQSRKSKISSIHTTIHSYHRLF